MFFNKEYEDRILCQTSCSPSAYSPTKKGYNSPGGDRFIPSRKDNHWESRFPNFSDPSENPGTHRLHTNEVGDRNKAVAYKCVLKNELLGMSFESVQKQDDDQEQKNMFEYLPPVKNPSSTCSASPLSPKSQQLLKSPMKLPRKISSTPYKVLDAPGLENDFYLNLVDWSSENYLAVGLEHCVYLWEATTCEVTKLCEFDRSNPISSVSWTEKGNYLAVGTDSGFVQVWDVAVKKCIRRLFGHSFRVGALAWNGEMLCSGSRDKSILLRDMRISSDPVRKFLGHSDEVCGLKWSPDNQYLASGGNDNCVHVWSMNSQSPIQSHCMVTSSPWASGKWGGTQDRHIRFWNTLTGQLANSVDTGSQVCNLLWSKHSQEFVSTHGYSENKVLVWKYPSLTQIAKLTGHSNRVVYLAMAPNGEDIVTGAGEEGTHDGTLRFWNVFSKTRSHTESKSVLQLFNTIR